jgi:hypothetical protein
VNRLLCGVFDAVDPAFAALGFEGPRESRQELIDKPNFSKLAAALGRTLRLMEIAVAESHASASPRCAQHAEPGPPADTRNGRTPEPTG